MKKSYYNLFIILLGFFYLFSGIVKIIDIDDFLYLMHLYNIKLFIFLAPAIPLIEILLGLLLLFRVRLKTILLFSFFLLIVFTLIFSYGYFFFHIDDCGCFGGIDFLKMPPFKFYLRNGLLLLITYYLFSLKELKEKPFKIPHFIILPVALLICCVILFKKVDFSLYTSPVPYTRSAIDDYHNSFISKNIHETVFKEYVSSLSTNEYVFFVFSFNCPHCIASTLRLNEYFENGVIDTVVGITYGSRAEERFFNQNVKVNFNYTKIKHIEMNQITGFYPLAFYVKNDTIRFKIKGSLPKYDEFIENYLNKQD